MSTLREIIEQCGREAWKANAGTVRVDKPHGDPVCRIYSPAGAAPEAWQAIGNSRTAKAQLIARLNPQTALLVLNALESCDHLLDSPNRTSQELAAWGRVLEALSALNGTPPTA